MASYINKLPSVVFDPDDFSNLVGLIDQETENATHEITIKYDGFTRTFTSADELFDDDSLPQSLNGFKLESDCDNGTVEISASYGELDDANLFIRGDSPWIEQMRSQIERYFNERKNRVRTLLRGIRMEILSTLFTAGLAIFSWIVVMDIFQPSDFIGLGYLFAILIVIGILSPTSWGNRIYPYIILKTERSVKTKIDYVDKAIIILAAIATFVGLAIQMGIINGG
jgi:hypothetical protein